MENVKLETFGDIVECSKQIINRAGEVDDQLDIIIRNGINHAYMNELGFIDKRIVNTYVPVINGIATLPDDLLSIEETLPSLKPGDRKIGNSIKTTLTGTLLLTYSYTREPLLLDADIPDLMKKYYWALVLYGCYFYYKHRKKFNEEQSYYAAYKEAINLKEDNNIQVTIKNMYDFGMEV